MSKRHHKMIGTFTVAAGMLLGGLASAGSLDPTNAPAPTMYTLEDIYLAVVGDPNVVNTSSGDATAGDLLVGKKAWVAGTEVTGTMPTRTLADTTTVVNAGYYEATTLNAVDGDLAPGNVRAGVTVFGVDGDPNVVNTGSGDATAADVMAGKKAWVDGAEVTGSIATRTLSDTTLVVNAGYYAGTTLSAVDGDLAPANVRAGVTVFGVNGDPNVVNTSSGDATAADVMAGKKGWVDGAEVTGTIATRTLSEANALVPEGFYEATTLTAEDADLATENVRAGVTIYGVTGKTEVVDTTSGDAVAGDVMAGKKAWVAGSEITGTIPTRVLADTTTVVNAGYYEATTLNAVDADMASTNIKKDVELFGITGTFEGSSDTYNAGVPRTGQTTSYAAGDDGDMEIGVVWPSPRFTDHEDGTVSDNLTGLMWAKNANLPGTPLNWTNSLTYCTNMNAGAGTYGYTDWRLPNVRELCSLLDYGRYWPALPSGHPFTNVANDDYWTSSTYAGSTAGAWNVMLGTGEKYHFDSKSSTKRVWPVRGGP